MIFCAADGGASWGAAEPPGYHVEGAVTASGIIVAVGLNSPPVLYTTSEYSHVCIIPVRVVCVFA